MKYFKIDVYNLDPKTNKGRKSASHWYKDINSANKAKIAIEKLSPGLHVIQTRENGPIKKVVIPKMTVSKIMVVENLN